MSKDIERNVSANILSVPRCGIILAPQQFTDTTLYPGGRFMSNRRKNSPTGFKALLPLMPAVLRTSMPVSTLYLLALVWAAGYAAVRETWRRVLSVAGRGSEPLTDLSESSDGTEFGPKRGLHPHYSRLFAIKDGRPVFGAVGEEDSVAAESSHLILPERQF